MSSLYVYGFTKKARKRSFGQIGYFRKEVRLIESGDLAALTSYYSQEIALSKESLLTHMKVLDAALNEGMDIIPLKFGTIAQSEEEVKALLKNGYSHWMSLLDRIAGKVELTLQIFWPDFDRKVSQMVKEDKTVADLRDKMLKEQSYKAQVTAGEIFKNIIEDKKKDEARRISQELIPLSSDVKENPYLTDTNVANISFLITRGSEEKFDRAVKKFAEGAKDKYLIRYYGPSVPFNFV